MKKLSKPTNLTLTAETIRQLDDQRLAAVAGAWTNTCLGTNCMCLPTYQVSCPRGCTDGLCVSENFTNCC
jgi:hypothetical protein